MLVCRNSKTVAALCLSGLLTGTAVEAQSAAPTGKPPVAYANPLVGTAPLDDQKLIGNAPPPGEQVYSGFTSPGAKLPHSAVEMAPMNANLALQYVAGVPATYYYPNRSIFAFSYGGYGGANGPAITPVVGDWALPPQRTPSVYDKRREKASPGYYSVFLDDFQTEAEMTATTSTGLYRFTFPQTVPGGKAARILVDTDHRSGDVEVVGDRAVRGRMMGGRRGAEDSYFVVRFSEPFQAFGTFHEQTPNRGSLIGDKAVEPDARAVAGPYAGAYLEFAAGARQVLVKVARGASYEQAEQRLEAEDPGWEFDKLHRDAEAAWARKLNRIEVEGGSEKEKMLFYSCLLHSFDSPNLVARKGEPFTGLDGVRRTADHDRYGPVPFWDTGRNQIVLLTLLEPEVKRDILQSELDRARESGYMGTSFHGDNAVFMYLGDWERGLDFDWTGTYTYLRKNATDPAGPRHYLAEYMRQGWIADEIPSSNPSPPYADGKAGAATTLEYSWDDYAMAEYAKRLGHDDDAAMFLKRAANYRNVFDPSIGFVRGRTADGKWVSPFDPGEPYYNFMMKEASGWSTLWLAPHDVQGLVNELGGREQAAAKLDQFFSTPYHPKGICRDCTGLIGQYVQGNQPDQQAAYYYDWVGQPWKTQALTRRILREMYGSDASGYAFPGMDDQGATSSWYVMSAMGFYTVDPSSPDYILGSPVFRRAVMHMGNGKDFEVDAPNNSDANIYIQSATLNGKPWTKPWFSHADIAGGGKLVLVMGPAPNKAWGAAPEDAPPSMSGPADAVHPAAQAGN